MNRSNEYNHLCKSCVYFSGCLFMLALIAGYIAYIVFGIISLIEDYGLSNDCKNSNLWEYVLVAIILSTSNFKLETSETDNIITSCSLIVILGIMNICLFVWGGVELWNKSCDELGDSNLWKIGLVSFILQLMCSIIALIITPILLYCTVLHNADNDKLQTENTTTKPLNVSTNV